MPVYLYSEVLSFRTEDDTAALSILFFIFPIHQTNLIANLFRISYTVHYHTVSAVYTVDSSKPHQNTKTFYVVSLDIEHK